MDQQNKAILDILTERIAAYNAANEQLESFGAHEMSTSFFGIPADVCVAIGAEQSRVRESVYFLYTEKTVIMMHTHLPERVEAANA
jgi:hypothetical protein